MSPEPVLRMRDLVVEYPADDDHDWRAVVAGVSLHLGPGERVGLVGESGSGKTVTALACVGLVGAPGRIRQGTVTVAGTDLSTATAEQLARIRGPVVGVVFQEPSSALNPVLSIGFQLAEAVRCQLGLGRSAARGEARRLLERAALDDAGSLVHAYPHQLSGGQLQRVMIALALAGKPRLLIADEPTTAVDLVTQARILGLLGSLVDEHQVGLLLISHDLAIVSGMVERVLVMYAGRVVEEGPTAELFAAPLHPYTRLLLASAAGRRGPAAAVASLPSSGCRFAPRCPLVQPTCREQEPELAETSTDRQVRCPVTAAGAGEHGHG